MTNEPYVLHPVIACQIVMLAHQDLGLKELSEKLAELQDQGYELHQSFSRPSSGLIAHELYEYVGRLDASGGTKGDFNNYHSLTLDAACALEFSVAQAFSKDFKGTTRFAKAAGLDTESFLERQIKNYVALRNAARDTSLYTKNLV